MYDFFERIYGTFIPFRLFCHEFQKLSVVSVVERVWVL